MSSWLTKVEIPSDSDMVARILLARFGKSAGEKVWLLDQGWDCFAYETDKGIVFKVPKRKSVFDTLRKEIFFLQHASKPLAIEVPDPRWIGEPGGDFPGPFLGYPKLPGIFLADVDARGLDLEAMAGAMGRFLTQLHGQDLEIFHALKLETVTPTLVNEQQLEHIDEAIAALEKLNESSLAAKSREFFSHWRPSPAPAQRPVLIHADLTLAHVLCDPVAGRFTGVIDWGDLCLGQPICDFFAVFAWAGEGFVRRVLKSYSGQIEEAEIEWLKQRAFFAGIFEAFYSLDTLNLKDRKSGLQALRMALQD